MNTVDFQNRFQLWFLAILKSNSHLSEHLITHRKQNRDFHFYIDRLITSKSASMIDKTKILPKERKKIQLQQTHPDQRKLAKPNSAYDQITPLHKPKEKLEKEKETLTLLPFQTWYNLFGLWPLCIPPPPPSSLEGEAAVEEEPKFGFIISKIPNYKKHTSHTPFFLFIYRYTIPNDLWQNH